MAQARHACQRVAADRALHATQVVHDRCHGVEPLARLDAELAAVRRADRERLVAVGALRGRGARSRGHAGPLGRRGRAVVAVQRRQPGGADAGEPDVLVAGEPAGREDRTEEPAFPGERLLGVAEGAQGGQVFAQGQVTDVTGGQIHRQRVDGSRVEVEGGVLVGRTRVDGRPHLVLVVEAAQCRAHGVAGRDVGVRERAVEDGPCVVRLAPLLDEVRAEPGVAAQQARGQPAFALQFVDHVLNGEAQPYLLGHGVRLEVLVALAGHEDAEQHEHADHRKHQHPCHPAADRRRAAQRVARCGGQACLATSRGAERGGCAAVVRPGEDRNRRRPGIPVDVTGSCAVPCAHLSTSRERVSVAHRTHQGRDRQARL